MNSAADLSKFRGNSVEIILSFYINYNEINLIYHILHNNYPLLLHRSNSVMFSHVIMRVIVFFFTTIFAPKDEYISAN